MTADPGAVQPGVVVRIRIRNLVYCSRRLPLDEAKQLAKQLRSDLSSLATGTGFMPFPDEHCDELHVRAAYVTAVEITPVLWKAPTRSYAANGMQVAS